VGEATRQAVDSSFKLAESELEIGSRLECKTVRASALAIPNALVRTSSLLCQIGSIRHRFTLLSDLALAFRAFCPSSRRSTDLYESAGRTRSRVRGVIEHRPSLSASGCRLGDTALPEVFRPIVVARLGGAG
jgi:hypothetical protein